MEGLGPMPHKSDEFINIPGHTAVRHQSVVALELCGFMLGLSAEVFFSPHMMMQMQMRVINKRHTFLGGLLHLPGSEFFFAHSK